MLVHFTFSSLIMQIMLSMLISICLPLLPNGCFSEFAKDTSIIEWGGKYKFRRKNQIVK